MINHLGHIVLTASRDAACLGVYTRVLGLSMDAFIGRRDTAAQAQGPAQWQSEVNSHVQASEVSQNMCSAPALHKRFARLRS